MIFALACAAAPAQAALPSSWAPGPIQPVPAVAGEHFGQSIANVGDLDGDGQDDVAVGAPDNIEAPLGNGITGRVLAFRSTGQLIWDVLPPAPQAPNVPASEPTRFGAKVTRFGDIGSCQSTGDNCIVGPLDGRPEVLVSAPGTDAPGASGADEGAVYVIDGATGRILKPVQLTERPATGSAGFGKSLVSMSGQPACARFGGVGACAYADDSAVAVGDLDGGGKADFAVGAPDFTETDATMEGVCSSICDGVGRVYVFSGEAISGSSTTTLTENEAPGAVTNSYPGAIGSSEAPHYGASLAPIGDIGRCTGTPDPDSPAATCMKPPVPLTNKPDGAPDLLVGAPGVDLQGAPGAGAVFLVDAAANAAMTRVAEPQAASASAFGRFDQGFPAVGNLGAGGTPDVVVPTPDGGAAIAFSGDPFGPSPFASVADSTPTAGGAFAAAVAGLGDIAGDAPTEIALGAAGGARAGAVHIASACANRVLKTIADPAGEVGARFGVTVAPIGDRNSDGFIDLAVGAPLSAGGAGRIYTFTSSGPADAFAGCNPSSNPGAGSGGGSKSSPTPAGTVRARVLRRLALVPSKRQLKSGSALRLNGSLKASAGQATCQRRQKIAIQRRKLSGGRFQTFEVAVTTKTGGFRTSTRPSRTYLYRARVSQTARCMGATSKTAKVVVRKRAKGG